MKGFLRFFLLPALFLAGSVYAVRLGSAHGSFFLYLLAAVLLGLAIGSYLRAWRQPPKE